MNKKHEVDLDDLPPELEDIPEDMLQKKPATSTGTGNLNLGDYAKPKSESETIKIPSKVEETKIEDPKKKESFGGID